MNRMLHYLQVVVLMVFLVFLKTEKTLAATCSGTTQYGEVVSTITVPVEGEYILWVRMQPTVSSTNLVQIEINGTTCYEVSGSSVPLNSWTWLNYQGGSTGATMKYIFNQAGDISIKIRAQSVGLKVDKIMLIGVDEKCSSNGSTPVSDGSNCDSAPAATISPPPPAEVTPTIVSSNSGHVQTVEYYINGELVQSSAGESPLDTAKLKNGEYQLTTKVTLKDGTQIEATESLIVDNGTFVEYVSSLFRSNRNILTSVCIAVLGAVSVFTVRSLIRFRHRRAMYLMHHGFSK